MTGSDATSALQLQQIWQRLASPVAMRLQRVIHTGLTPQKLALTISLGAMVGTMPLIWGTSLLCIFLAMLFRLNQPALQAINCLCFPLQLALFVPFCKLGLRFFPWGPTMPDGLLAMMTRIPDAASGRLYGLLILKSLAAWLVIMTPVICCLYLLLSVVLAGKFVSRRRRMPDNNGDTFSKLH